MNKAFFFPDQRVTDNDMNFIETSRADAIRQQFAFMLAKFNHQYSGSIPAISQQTLIDLSTNPTTYRGIGGGYGSNYLLPITGSLSSISINRGWGVTDGMDIIILTGSVTVNQGDNTFNKKWGTLTNGQPAYVTVEYQEASSSVGTDANGNTYYKRYTGDYLVRVSSTYPSGSNQIPLAQFTANGNLITAGTFLDVREWARPWAMAESTFVKNSPVASLNTVEKHITAVGTGVPSATNPHGLSINDLGFTDSISAHRIQEHGNGIIVLDSSISSSFSSFSGSVVSPTSHAFINFTPPVNAVASINGVLFSGSIPALSASSAPSDGVYYAVINQVGTPSFISTASITFDTNNPLKNPQYLFLGKATISDNGDDISSYTDLRTFYTMSQSIIRGDLVESVQNPSSSLSQNANIMNNLSRIRYQLGQIISGSSTWNGGVPTSLVNIKNAIGQAVFTYFDNSFVTQLGAWNGQYPVTDGINVIGSYHGVKSLSNQFSKIERDTSLFPLNTERQNLTGRTVYMTAIFSVTPTNATNTLWIIIRVGEVSPLTSAYAVVIDRRPNIDVSSGTVLTLSFFVPPYHYYYIDTSSSSNVTITVTAGSARWS